MIVAVDGQPVQHSEELPRVIAGHAPGSQVSITLLRNGRQQQVNAKLGALREESEANAGETNAPHERGTPTGKLGLSVSNAQGGGARVEKASRRRPWRQVFSRGT